MQILYFKLTTPVPVQRNHDNIIDFHKETFVSVVASFCVSCQKHCWNSCKPSHLVTVMFSLELSSSSGFSDWYLLSKRRMCFEFLNVNILLPLFCQLRCHVVVAYRSGRNLVIGVYFYNAWLPLVRLDVQRNDNLKVTLWKDYVSLAGHSGY